MRRSVVREALPVAEDPVEMWAFVDTGEPVRPGRRGGRVTALPDGRYVFTELPKRGQPGVSAVVEIRPFRRVFYLVVKGGRVVSFHKVVPR